LCGKKLNKIFCVPVFRREYKTRGIRFKKLTWDEPGQGATDVVGGSNEIGNPEIGKSGFSKGQNMFSRQECGQEKAFWRRVFRNQPAELRFVENERYSGKALGNCGPV